MSIYKTHFLCEDVGTIQCLPIFVTEKILFKRYSLIYCQPNAVDLDP